MLRDKKGLSMVVTTLLIILLVIIAVGIIWVVVRGTLQRGSGQVDLGTRCLEVTLKATKATCDAVEAVTSLCSVTMNREAGGEAIGGAKLVITDGIDSVTKDVPNNIAALETQTESAIDVTTLTANVTSIDVAVYFLDDSGNEQLCATTTTFEDVALTPA